VRQPALLILWACGLLMAGSVAAEAFSPADLFWRADTDSLSEGAADVPGQITRRPQVRRPTSLPHTDQGQLRLDCWSQTSLALEQETVGTVGKWHTDVRSAEFALPLGKPADRSRWTLGLQVQEISDCIGYDDADVDIWLSLSSLPKAVAVAYECSGGWTIGAAGCWAKTKAVARGDTVADYLGLPSGSARWPRMSSDSQQYSLGISRTRHNWEWGLQHDWSAPSQIIRVTKEDSQLSGALDADVRRWEAYTAHNRGDEALFLAARDFEGRSNGAMLAGLAARADLQGTVSDTSVAIGWRKNKPSRTQQLMLDWRHSKLRSQDRGYTAFLPWLADEIYDLTAGGEVSTLSLRYGRQTPLDGNWSLLSSMSLHYSVVDANCHLGRSEEAGEEAETIAEYRIRGGILRMLDVGLGVAYQGERYRGALVYVTGLAAVNDAFGKRFDDENHEPSEEPSNHLKTKPFVSLSLEYRF